MYFHLLLQYSGEFYMRNTGMLFPCEVNMIITLFANAVCFIVIAITTTPSTWASSD